MIGKPFQVRDRDLWEAVRREVTPLGRAKIHGPPAPPPRPKPLVSAPPLRPKSLIPPPLTGLDRRTERRLTRGSVEIDATLDLHGTGVELARHQLLQFLQRNQILGSRLVLVITGKGSSPFARHTLHGRGHFHAPEREGLIRRRATEWFHEPDFRHLVSGFQPAHPKHGGGGAFYVKVRRIRP